MNKIMNEIIKRRNGLYCHCVEVSATAILEGVADSIYEEYRKKYGLQEVLDFLETLTIYYRPYRENKKSPENKKQVYTFNFREYVLEHLED